MTDVQVLLRVGNELAVDELKQRYLYITERRIQFCDSDCPQQITGRRSDETRIPALHEHLGHAWMSVDFSAQLPDSFWLSEDKFKS